MYPFVPCFEMVHTHSGMVKAALGSENEDDWNGSHFMSRNTLACACCV